ncbi:MAG: aspartate aminotransferase family protein [Limisphaerales bacterium]
MRRSTQILDLLRACESRNVTFIEPDGSWPIVWRRARGVRVWDADGKKYLDLTAAFAVAAAGHANARVVKAGQRQMATLLHAMGDVHPHALKAELARKLSEITFERWSGLSAGGTACSRPGNPPASAHGFLGRTAARGPSHTTTPTRGKTIFGNSGFEAVEAALKTALLATKKPGVLAFRGAYHGLGYGALNATHRDFFRSPFHSQLREFGRFVPFPTPGEGLAAVEASMRRLLRTKKIGAVLVEPVQGRGGINVPPHDFLPLVRQLCDEHGALLIADEILTGFGRTGKWFACEHTATVPDLVCLGKALTGGFPLSACVGRADLMDAAWPASTGEAIHTSTFLGHPVGCAMALAQIAEIRDRNLVGRSARLGTRLLGSLNQLATTFAPHLEVRGLGLMAGVELKLRDGSPATEVCLRVIKRMLCRGFILLPEGEHANVISLTPPLTITPAQLACTIDALANVLAASLNLQPSAFSLSPP